MKGYSVGLAILILLLCFNVPTSHAQYRTATVVGRFIIKNPVHGQYKKKKRLYFSGKFDKGYNQLIKTKDSGYFMIDLPLGYTYLEKIVYSDGGEFLKKFPSDYLEIKLDSVDRVYYIGDMVLTWDITISEERPEQNPAFGLLGGLAGAAIGRAIQQNKEGKIPTQALPVSVTTNPETIAYFSKKMKIAEEFILTAPVSIDPNP